MKWFKLLAAAPILYLLLASCSNNSQKRERQEKCEVNPECVYVCSGQSAKRYHSINDCMGLSRCSGEILEMTIEEAEENDKSPCRLCVGNL